MSLTHVLRWTDKYGYRRVTASEAGRLYPGTVSARSKIFICGICGEAVTFTAGGAQIRHFRHGRAAQNEECEDRAQAYGYNLPAERFSDKIETLPVRLKCKTGHWKIELGLLALPDSIFNRYSQRKLRIFNAEGNKVVYHLAERLTPNQCTWLGVGRISAAYRLSLDDSSPLPMVWPKRVQVLGDYTLFDVETGRRLPVFPDVEVGREYYLISQGRGPVRKNEVDVRINPVPFSEHGCARCSVYRICALRFSQYAAGFFLRIGANLKRQSPRIFPLWPAVIRTPHLIYHDADELFVLLEGEGLVFKAFPSTLVEELLQKETVCLISFSCGKRIQTLAGYNKSPLLELVRYSHVLRYDYFIRRKFDQIASLPEVKVTDRKGKVIEDDWQENVRPETLLYVQGEYDGEVWLQGSESLFPVRRTLKGGKPLVIKVGMGKVLTIFQGLDSVRTIVFARPGQKKQGASLQEFTKKEAWTDSQLVRHLRRMCGDEVESPRSLSTFVRFFKKWRLVEVWLRQQQTAGCISRRAQKLLQNIIKNESR